MNGSQSIDDSISEVIDLVPFPIIGFHGSPGSPEDFSGFKEFSHKRMLLLPNRNCINSGLILSEIPVTSFIALGYSWGCAEALNYANQNAHKLKAFIFIAPYLHPEKNMNSIFKFVLNSHVFSKILFKLIAKKSIQKFLYKSAFPQTPSTEYAGQLNFLSQSEILRFALLEKHKLQPTAIDCAERLKQIKVPVLIISGSQDTNLNASEHASQLEKLFSNAKHIKLADAGHALPWTRSSECIKEINSFLKDNNI